MFDRSVHRYVDLQKTYAVLLGILYKTLHNIAARRQAEAEEPVVKAVLEKRQRTDVMQKEKRLKKAEKALEGKVFLIIIISYMRSYRTFLYLW